jgi:hypothetical protein
MGRIAAEIAPGTDHPALDSIKQRNTRLTASGCWHWRHWSQFAAKTSGKLRAAALWVGRVGMDGAIAKKVHDWLAMKADTICIVWQMKWISQAGSGRGTPTTIHVRGARVRYEHAIAGHSPRANPQSGQDEAANAHQG